MSEYVTVLGDTIQGIAERNGHPGEGAAIRAANPELVVEGDTPQIGTVLNVPWDAEGVAAPAHGASTRHFGLNWPFTRPNTSPPADPPPVADHPNAATAQELLELRAQQAATAQELLELRAQQAATAQELLELRAAPIISGGPGPAAGVATADAPAEENATPPPPEEETHAA